MGTEDSEGTWRLCNLHNPHYIYTASCLSVWNIMKLDSNDDDDRVMGTPPHDGGSGSLSKDRLSSLRILESFLAPPRKISVKYCYRWTGFETRYKKWHLLDKYNSWLRFCIEFKNSEGYVHVQTETVTANWSTAWSWWVSCSKTGEVRRLSLVRMGRSGAENL